MQADTSRQEGYRPTIARQPESQNNREIRRTWLKERKNRSYKVRHKPQTGILHSFQVAFIFPPVPLLLSEAWNSTDDLSENRRKVTFFSNKGPLSQRWLCGIACRWYWRVLQERQECLFVHLCLYVCVCVCLFCLCVCIMGENEWGCTLSPRNSICVVNALFKTIDIHSGLYTVKEHEVCGLMCVCVCTYMMGALMRQGEDAWACVWAAGPPSDRLLGSRWAEVLSGCWRDLPEPEETHTHTLSLSPNSLWELTASFSCLHLGWGSIA